MRVRLLGLVSLAGMLGVLAVLLALAGNAATSDAQWPGPLDELRRHPWPWVGALSVLSVVAAGVAAWMQERSPAVGDDPPPPQPASVPGWFVDRAQTRATVAAVCEGGRAVGITTSLWGAGGFGKTTLATIVCAHRHVRRRFRSRIYLVTIGRDVRGRATVAAKVAEVTRFVTGDTTEFDDPDLAGAHLGRLLDQRPRTLLVLDDVWDDEQLAPFLHGGSNCVRLVTTRNPHLLPPGTHRIQVDEMSPAQARSVLTWELPPLPEAVIDGLLQATGRWALLLRLTNRLIAEQTATGADPAASAERVLQQLRARGPAAVDDPGAVWNLDDSRQRSQAAKASIEAATTLLPPGGADRFSELGIFAEDELVPVSTVALLWQATSELTEEQTRVLCRHLERLSLIVLESQHGGRIGLHDIVRDYLRNGLEESGLARINGLLVDAAAAALPPAQPLAPTAPHPERAWWELDHSYLLDHLIGHFIAAGRTSSAEAVAGDLRWVEARLTQRGPSAPWNDLARINTPHAQSLARSIAQAAHILTPTDPPHALTSVLHSRLDAHPHWHIQINARQDDPALRPCLVNRWPPPDSPHPALQRTLTGHTEKVASVAIAPDGTWLATGGSDRTVRIWDRVSGTCTATLTGHTSAVHSVAIAPDGTWLATSDSARTVRIWDRVSGTCTATLTGHTRSVNSVAIAPDGTWLATGDSLDHKVRIWDRASGTCTATLTGHTSAVNSVAIAPDGTWLATGASDHEVRIWDHASGACTAILTGHTSTVHSVAIAPDGTWLATGGDSDREVRIWDRASGTCTATLTGHATTVNSVAIAPDGTWLATGGGIGDHKVRIWDPASGTCTATLTDHTSSVESVAIAPDGSWLASGSYDETVRIWDREAADRTSSGAGRIGWVESVAIAPDTTWVATTGGDYDRKVRIWDLASGTCTSTLTGHTGWIDSVAIAPDGTWLASTGPDYDPRVQLWDKASGACTATLTGHTGAVHAVAIAPGGTWLATGGYDQTVRIWDRVSGTCTATLTGHTGWIESVAIAPDGIWLATGASDNEVRIWDLASGTCTATLTGHTGWIDSVAIAPDGTWLASTGRDGTVRIWDRASGTCTATLTGHTSSVTAVAIAPDCTCLATISSRTVQIWHVAEQRILAVARAEGRLISCIWGETSHELAVGGEQGVYLLALLT
ncbi:NB-ARC domain-containing protein [Streptomyces sp. NPDC056002]|uniref:NB-ARC domain-containing protein n=1 Tax=Streptomyces sp. NPDC056002 TaxID=3345675 RepID=UPI0035DE9B9D